MNRSVIIKPDTTLIEALEYMDKVERKLLIVCDNDVFNGVISIGDIQRALINKKELSDIVMNYIRPDIIFGTQNDDIDDIKDLMKKERIECMPIVDADNKLIDIIEWSMLFDENEVLEKTKIDCDVVIMAGGKGERLLPLTNLIPKPLVPISDKTIIESIMDKFVEVGCEKFYLSVNYMADVIKKYFDKKDYQIEYLEEDIPLGTAGSLYLLKKKINRTFIVSNCDILLDINFEDLIKYHKQNRNMATVVSVLKSYQIPYGTIKTQNNGLLVALNEKPTISYQINAGLYILEPGIFDYFDDGEFVHITDLLMKVVESGNNVGVFPVSEGSWRDMGNWKEYMKIIKGDAND